jgi:hypothetical protein
MEEFFHFPVNAACYFMMLVGNSFALKKAFKNAFYATHNLQALHLHLLIRHKMNVLSVVAVVFLDSSFCSFYN